jgi:hypothetical protein
MGRVRLANFVIGAGLHLLLASPFQVGGSLHLRGDKIATKLEGQHREYAMAGTVVSIYHYQGSLPVLYLSEKIAPRIAPALEELVGDRATEVLPALQNLFLEGLQPSEPVQEGIAKFIATRQLSGHPVTVSLWERATFRSSRAIRP